MKKTAIIFLKELKDTLRDRRTLVVMIIIPLLLFPVLISISTQIMVRQKKEAEVKELKVALVRNDNAAEFADLLEKSEKIAVFTNIPENEIADSIRAEKIDFGLVFARDFDRVVASRAPGTVRFYLKSSQETDLTGKRIRAVLNEFKENLLTARLGEMQLDRKVFEVITIDKQDIVTVKERIGEAIGGFLPYIFVIFCFVGAMYPAIDLAAGEKERGTIETLLASPASRMEIVLGKFGVVFLAGLFSAGMSILGLYIALKQTSGIPEDLLSALIKIIDIRSILMMFSLLIPLCIFFAAILLSISIFAHTFKEAQSIMTPMNILVIVPVFIGLFPGFKLNPITALIPVLNVSLATREIIAGNIQTLLLAEVFISLTAIALLSLAFCTRWFRKENVIFRAG